MIINIVMWTLLIVSFIVIVAIIIKKLPVLVSIDISQIEAEKQAELKKRILNDKFKRDINRLINTIGKFVVPVVNLFVGVGQSIYNKLVNLKEAHSQISIVTKEDIYKKMEVLFAEADDLTRKDDLVSAEKKYIEIIGLDGKSFKAFELLADNYYNRNDYDEAEQTLMHVIKLKMQLMKVKRFGLTKLDLARNYYSLSLVYQKLADTEKAFDYLKQALELEPANPKYLDKTLEVCIMLKLPSDARAFCRQLEESNPSNKKIKEFKDQIKDLEGKGE